MGRRLRAEGAFASPVPSERLTAAGPVSLPIVYDDTSAIGAVFTVDAEAVADTVRPHGLRPLAVGGRALAMVAVFDYRRTSIGPYREACLAFAVQRHARIGFWIDKLPVTTNVACAAGTEIWGYPKWVTKIEWGANDRMVRAKVGDEIIVEVGSPWSPALPLPLPFLTYTALDGGLVRTRVGAHVRAQFVPGRRASVQVLGTGRLADRVNSLGLTRRPLFGLRMDRFHSELPAGRFVVGPSGGA